MRISTHYSQQWHHGAGTDPYTWCHSCYMSSRRLDSDDIRLWHPTLATWKNLQDIDRTGCQIDHLSRRPDVQALRNVNALSRVKDGWRKLNDGFVYLFSCFSFFWHDQWQVCGRCCQVSIHMMLQRVCFGTNSSVYELCIKASRY